MSSEHSKKVKGELESEKSNSFWKFFGFKNFRQFKKQLRTVWPLVAIAVVLITIPVVLFLAQQRQEIRQRAAYGDSCATFTWTNNGQTYHGSCVPDNYSCVVPWGQVDCQTGYKCSVAQFCVAPRPSPSATSRPSPSPSASSRPSPSPLKYSCSITNGCYVNANGPYTTFNSCALNCASEPDPSPSPTPVTKYSCSPTNGCYVNANGPYVGYPACANNCPSEPRPRPSPTPQTRYSCSITNGCVVSSNGPYTTFNSCALNCASEPDPSPSARPSPTTYCSNLGTTCTIDQQCCSGVCHDTLGKCTRTAACSTTGTTCTISQQCCFDSCNSGYCGARPSPRPTPRSTPRATPRQTPRVTPRPSATPTAPPPSTRPSTRPSVRPSTRPSPTPSGLNNSPYCQFVSPNTSTIALNATRNFTVNGGDVDGNMNKLEMWYAPTISPNGQWVQMTPRDTTSPFEMVRGLTCTPAMAGKSYYVVCNGYDSTNRNCTGNPQNTSPSFAYDCGPNDMVTVSCATAVASPTPSPSALASASPSPSILPFTLQDLKDLLLLFLRSGDGNNGILDGDLKVNMLNTVKKLKILFSPVSPSTTPGTSVPPTDLQVTGFSLIDTTTNQVISTLSADSINDINAADLPNRAVRANTGGTDPGSVVFKLNDVVVSSDNTRPYRLEYANLLNFDFSQIQDGIVRLMGEPHSGADGTGNVGTSLTVTIRVNGL